MQNASNVVIAVLVLALIVVRQLRPRSVNEGQPYRLMVALGLVGLVELIGFSGRHAIRPIAWLLLGVSLLGGMGLGAVRGALVHIWRRDGVLIRQGNWLTAVLWVGGLAIHLGIDAVIGRVDSSAAGLGQVAVLLYLGLALAAQRYVTLRRSAQAGAFELE